MSIGLFFGCWLALSIIVTAAWSRIRTEEKYRDANGINWSIKL